MWDVVMNSFSSPRQTCNARTSRSSRRCPSLPCSVSLVRQCHPHNRRSLLHYHRLDRAFSNHGHKVLVVANVRRLGRLLLDHLVDCVGAHGGVSRLNILQSDHFCCVIALLEVCQHHRREYPGFLQTSAVVCKYGDVPFVPMLSKVSPRSRRQRPRRP